MMESNSLFALTSFVRGRCSILWMFSRRFSKISIIPGILIRQIIVLKPKAKGNQLRCPAILEDREEIIVLASSRKRSSGKKYKELPR